MQLKNYIVAFLVLISASALAQHTKVQVLGATPNLYIVHEIQSGETLSAISKIYGTAVGDIMRLNGMNAQSKLAIGQKINVPVAASNLVTADPIPANALALVHTVQAGETLYRISFNHGKVPVASIAKWNSIANNAISVGQHLVVAYLKVSGKPAGAVVFNGATNGNTSVPTVVTSMPSTPANQQPATIPATAPTSSTNTTTPPLSSDGSSTTTTTNTAPSATNTSPTVTIAPSGNAQQVVNTPPEVDYSKRSVSGEGVFASSFGKGVEGRDKTTITGMAATFKSTSGWTDKKFYILMNDVPPGQIVKVTTAEGKTIYAKVLWSMKDMRDSDGLQFRISNAAASALGIAEGIAKFSVSVTYFE
ncbi:MAG: LysM peptidoglycan-binding domain-containing protein [Chitinophagaceae bacterium]